MSNSQDGSVDEGFRNYRTSGIGLSATLITLSSALIIWLRSLIAKALPIGDYRSLTIYVLAFIGCCLTIIFSLCIQFFNYQGYKHQARAKLPQPQSTQQQANSWFNKEDFCVIAAFISIIGTLILSIACFMLNNPELRSNARLENIDLTTPEKTMALFVKAFTIGDDNLLTEVLAPNASLPEFNPMQKINCPSPRIKGFDVRKFRVVLSKGQYAADSQPGDIEMYVRLIIDENVAKNGCKMSLWEKGTYLLRSTNNKWKIVAVAPFWPDEIEH